MGTNLNKAENSERRIKKHNKFWGKYCYSEKQHPVTHQHKHIQQGRIRVPPTFTARNHVHLVYI